MEKKYKFLENFCQGMLAKSTVYNLCMEENPVIVDIYKFIKKNKYKNLYIKLSFDAKSIYICERRGNGNYILKDYDI